MATRNSICAHCGAEFSYQIGRGTDRKYCSDACSNKASALRKADRHFSKCIVDGCDGKATRIGAGMCESHYMRVRRNGSFEKVDTVIPGAIRHSGGGYLLEYAPDHRLRTPGSPRVYQHRIVFYETHGEGPFQCHCCGKSVTWQDMHVDHLNDVVTDNRPENLAAACAVCNQWRGRSKMRKTSKEQRGRHWTAHGVTMCQSDWSRHLGVTVSALTDRIKRGASIDDALQPRGGKTGPKSTKPRVPLCDLHVIRDTRPSGACDWAV